MSTHDALRVGRLVLGPVLFLEDDVLVLDPGLFVVGFFWGVLEKREREEKKKKKSEKEEKKKLENKNPKRKKNSKKKKGKRTPRGRSSSAVHTSPGDHAMGTRAIDRKDQPKGICDPPMQSIWRLEEMFFLFF